MAEEDEIDVLGDFTLDNLLSKNEPTMFDNSSLMSQGAEILNLNDYTIHPQWLLDKPSTNPACWYNSGTEFGLNFEQTNPMPGEASTESITDESGWTEKEKDLIKRGIEIFGKSHVRLSQFIGSRTPAEVKYFLKNFYSYIEKPNNIQDEVVFDNLDESITHNAIGIEYAEVLDEKEIPASIEEVIAAVSTAKPTVNVNKAHRVKKKSVSIDEFDINYKDIPSGQSLLKSNYQKYSMKEDVKISKHTSTFKDVKHKRPLTASKKMPRTPEKSKTSKVKFKTNISMVSSVPKSNFVKKRRKSSRSTSESSSTFSTSNSNHEIVTGTGLSVPVCSGEEIILIKKENTDTNSDSDIEIDVEDLDDDISRVKQNDVHQNQVQIKTEACDNTMETVVAAPKTEEDAFNSLSNDFSGNKNVLMKKRPDLSTLDSAIVEQLMDMSFPTGEIKLADNEISELEKFIHYEFFEGRPTKTPARYLKIRNHIINNWNVCKPVYVTKTSVRNGLKQCGDVNCIGRIHNYLEQIGAINFGCAQTSYIRPLYEMVLANNSVNKEKVKDVDGETLKQKLEVLGARPRFKKKYINDGEGGCTYLHDERGDVINTTVVNEEPIIKRNYIKKPTVKLMYCRSFSEENPQKFSVRIDLSVVLLMDLHAHTSLTEVMGLVGGYWDPNSRKLYITRYEPCRNIAPSSTHCDMCPITQAKAAEKMHNSGLNILGWFHSHPTFAPEPSQQDIDTQLSVQQWIGADVPCVGIILSPFSGHGALIASPFRCLIVDKKENFEDQFVPYKFKVELISDTLKVREFLESVKAIYNSEYIAKENKVDFSKKFFQDNSITFLDKFVTSIKMHLAKCSNINKMMCDRIIQGVTDVCSNNI